MDINSIKRNYGILGKSIDLNRAIDIAVQVSSTDITTLVTGESGTGKENIPKIIHSLSNRKHENFISVNCGAIPEGTIDSELFGHVKGAFTGAHETRKGYFEVANKGTIFLDEVGELPMSTQARLLRVLENGEYIKVGSSEVSKTDVRIIAATNVNLSQAIKDGKFREDLYYRLSTININLPPLRKRGEDIQLLFRKFAVDFADKYNTDPIILDNEAIKLIQDYNWPGNIRELKNFVQNLSVLEKEKNISKSKIVNYLSSKNQNLPIIKSNIEDNDFSEREILYKVLFDMKKDLNHLKKITDELIGKNKINKDDYDENILQVDNFYKKEMKEEEYFIEQNLSLFEHEKNLISKALNKHNGKRKNAAKDLGISERTLYRKIKELNL
jgi:transcriptional regulator with PAS, ATPase and Fis domain